MRAEKNSLLTAIVVLGMVAVGDIGFAAEKIRFGASPRSKSIVTKPVVERETINPRPEGFKDNVNVSPSFALPPSAGTVTIQAEGNDDGREDWIFQDSRSAVGIQEALGVETYEIDFENRGIRSGDATSSMESYIERQNQLRTPNRELEFEGFKTIDSLGGNLGNSGLGADQPNVTRTSLPNLGFGQSGFKNTLNSENPTVRSYYRDVFKNQISPPSTPVTPALEAELQAFDERSAAATSRELYNRAALIESMTQKMQSGLTLPQTTGLGSPAVKPPTRAVDDKPILERRGGRTVMPSRPY